MPKTPGKIHMYDMVKIDTMVFEIVVGGGGGFKSQMEETVYIFTNFHPHR